MKKRLNIREPPVLWAIPFTLLLIIIIIVAADKLFPFIPINGNRSLWMWATSTLITTIIASLISEYISMKTSRAAISMVLATIISTLIYSDLFNIFQRSFVDSVYSYFPNPFYGDAVYASLLTFIPGALTGIILGGIFGFFPEKPILKDNQNFEPKLVDNNSLGTPYRKICDKCENIAPFDSKFCHFCGTILQKKLPTSFNFCKFCGSQISYHGRYCPECGGTLK